MLALTVAESGELFGIVAGTATIVGGAFTAYLNYKKDKPEPPTVVMSAGESGVKVLNGVVEILRVENDRYRLMISERDKRIDQLLAERERDMEERERDLRDKERRIRELTTELDDKNGKQ